MNDQAAQSLQTETQEPQVEGQAVTEDQAVVQSEDFADRAGGVKTIYDVSGFEIAWRNFLAGMSRALGGIFLYVVLVFFVGVVISNYVVPRIQPMVNSFQEALESMSSLKDLPGSFQLPSQFSLPQSGGDATVSQESENRLFELQEQLQQQIDTMQQPQ